MTVFRKLISACAAATLVAACGLAQAQTEIRISTAAPDNSPLSEAMRAVKTRMEAKFPGAIKVSVHAASALFRQGTEIPALQRGNLEMSTPVTFEIEAQLPEWGILGAAYLFRDIDHMLKTMRGEIGKEYFADIEKKMDIVILGTGYLGTRTLDVRTDKPVLKPADLAGMKLRMPPGPTYQMLGKALGATVVSMPITEVYLGLKTGAIDGQDNPTSMTRDWKFYEVTKQIPLTNHLIQPVFVAIAKPFFSKLTPTQQTELRAAVNETLEKQIAQTIADEKSAIELFKKQGLSITQPDLAAFRATVHTEYEKGGLTAKWKPGLAARIAAVK